jgi:flagellar biosynthesis/type III secretory pathway protein FliH
MNMKSFNRSRLNSSPEKAVAWNPPEMNVDLSLHSTVVDIDKEKVIALFHKEEPFNDRKSKTSRSALQPRGMTQNVTAWEPSIAAWHTEPEAVLKDVWDFMLIEEDPDNEWKEAESAPGIPVEKPVKQELPDPEIEVKAILERARLQAEEIILAAQAQADDVLLQAQTEIEDQKKEGYQQGLKEARLEMEEALQAVRAMVTEVDTWKNNLMAQGEQILVEMLKEIARKLFGDGAELDPQALQTNLNRIMDSAHGLGGLNIFLNPKDARILDSAWVDQQLLISGGQAKIIPSANITRGGCYVKGNMGTVDGRVETQLEALLKAFDQASNLAE